MSKVHIARQGYLTKSALPNVTRTSDTAINSQLLLLGSGANGSTTFTDSSVNNRTITAVGNAQISTAQFPSGSNSGMTSSMLFDGDVDRLSMTSFTLTGNFTIEMYVYLTAAQANWRMLCGQPTPDPYFAITSTGLEFQFGSTAATAATATQTFSLNTWIHIAAVRNNNGVSFYVNGQSRTVTNSTQTNNFIISSVGNAFQSNYGFIGYISNFRVTPAAVYTANFNPPRLPLANSFSANTALSTLINANQTTDNVSNTEVIDSSSFARLVNYTAGFPSIAQISPFTSGNSGSIFFDGFADFLTMTDASQLQMGSGDFTIECWINMPDVTTQQGIYDQRITTASLGVPTIYVQSGTIRYFTLNADRITSSTIATNTWYHLAIVRIGTTTTMYLNGVVTGTPWTDTTTYSGNANRPIIGSLGSGGNSTSTNNAGFRGFITNVRIVKGIGVYTGAFTPSTAPLTATQSAGTNIAAISGTETSLLLNCAITSARVLDSSTQSTKALVPSSFNSTPIGGQVNFHPYSGAGKYGSYWFDGNQTFIDTPANTDYQFDGDFTIEAWIYRTDSNKLRWISGWWPQSGSVSWIFYIDANNRLGFFRQIGGSTASTVGTSTIVPQNAWTHVAVTRSGSTLRLWVNGIQDSTTGSMSGTVNFNSAPLRIGGDTSLTVKTGGTLGLSSNLYTGPDTFLGYVTGYRIIKGTAVYSGAFTPPTIQPVDVSGAASAASYPSTTNVNTTFASSQTSLLCRFDRWTIQDNDVLPRPIYLTGSVTTSATQSRFGGRSLTVSSVNNNSSLYLASSQTGFGTGDFTLACWVYLTALSGQDQQLFMLGAPGYASASGTIFFNINTSGQLFGYRLGVAGYQLESPAGGANYWLNTWRHVAIVRSSGTVRAYLDGVNTTSNSNFNGISVPANGALIGTVNYDGIPVYPWVQGFLDDIVIANTAIYTSNFTPPSTQATDPLIVAGSITNNTYGVYQNY